MADYFSVSLDELLFADDATPNDCVTSDYGGYTLTVHFKSAEELHKFAEKLLQ